MCKRFKAEQTVWVIDGEGACEAIIIRRKLNGKYRVLEVIDGTPAMGELGKAQIRASRTEAMEAIIKNAMDQHGLSPEKAEKELIIKDYGNRIDVYHREIVGAIPQNIKPRTPTKEELFDEEGI